MDYSRLNLEEFNWHLRRRVSNWDLHRRCFDWHLLRRVFFLTDIAVTRIPDMAVRSDGLKPQTDKLDLYSSRRAFDPFMIKDGQINCYTETAMTPKHLWIIGDTVILLTGNFFILHSLPARMLKKQDGFHSPFLRVKSFVNKSENTYYFQLLLSFKKPDCVGKTYGRA